MNRLTLGARKFLYSDAYLFLFSLLVFTAWCFGFEKYALIAVLLISALLLFLNGDSLPLLAPLFMAAFIFPKNVSPSEYYTLLYAVIPLVAAIVFRAVKHKGKWKLGGMFFPQLAVSIALLFGGAFTIGKEHYLGALGFSMLLGFVILALYFIINNFTKEDSKRDTALYVSKIMMWAGLIICAELFVFYLRSGKAPAELFNDSFDLGWGISNNAATILLLSAPITCYTATRYDNGFVYAFLAAIQYVFIILTYSRGGILFAAVTVPVAIVFLIIKSCNRKRMLAALGVLLAVLAGVYAAFFGEINAVFKTLLGLGFGSSGRDLLYKEAIEVFLKNPIFGAGMGYHGDFYAINNMSFYWFHSTLFQVIGSLGVVGILAYVYYYIARYVIVFKGIKKNTFNIFVLIAFIGFEGYSMMDTGTFVPIPIMAMVILLTLVLEITNKNIFSGRADNYNRLIRCKRAVDCAFAQDENAISESGTVKNEPRMPKEYAKKYLFEKHCNRNEKQKKDSAD